MKFRLIQTVIALSLLLTACGGDDDGSPTTGGDDGEEPITASYTATITTEFTAENFPQDYPSNPSFGPLVIITHAPDVDVFSTGQMASDGFEAYVETGDVDALGSFITAQVGADNEGRFTITTGGTLSADGTTTIDLNFTPVLTRVTIIANLNPSPDWFIGIDSFDITDGDTLITNEVVGLRPLDGGSSGGDTYEAPDEVENGNVTAITGAPFSMGGPVQDIGSVEFTRVD